MPQKRDEQTKSTLARDRRSSGTDADAEAKDLQEEYEEEFRAIVANATAAYERYHAPPTRPGSRQYPEADQWPKDSKALFGKFAQELCDIRRNFSWVRQNAKQAFLVFAGLCEGWITVISQLESDRTGESAEGLRSKYRRGIARAIRLALANAKRRLERREGHVTGQTFTKKPDPFAIRIGELMQKHPLWSNERIIGKYVDEGREVPVRWKKHDHREGDMLDVYRCPKCKHPLEALIARIRRKLGLPHRR